MDLQVLFAGAALGAIAGAFVAWLAAQLRAMRWQGVAEARMAELGALLADRDGRIEALEKEQAELAVPEVVERTGRAVQAPELHETSAE